MGELRRAGRKAGLAVAIILAAVVISSCGYKLISERGIYGGDIKSVSLSVKNPTYEPHVALYVTNAFSREILSIGLFDLNAPNPDASLEGKIRQITILPSSMNSGGVVIEKTASMIVDISLIKKDGTFIKKWEFTDSEPYNVEDVAAEDYNKRNAFEIISGRIGRKLTTILLVDY